MVFPYFEFAIGFSLVVYVFETLLNLRQRARLAAPKPSSMTYIDNETFAKSSAYSRYTHPIQHHTYLRRDHDIMMVLLTQPLNSDKSSFGLVQEAWNIAFSTWCLVVGILPYFWNWSGDIITSWGYSIEVNTIIHALVFNGINLALSTVCLERTHARASLPPSFACYYLSSRCLISHLHYIPHL
jgi:hypothetical protein